MLTKINLYGTSFRVVSGVMNDNLSNGVANDNCKIVNNQNHILHEFSSVQEFKTWWIQSYGSSEYGLVDGIYAIMHYY